MGESADRLDRLAELSRLGPDEVIDAALRAARETLGMELAFMSRIDDGHQTFERAEATSTRSGWRRGPSSRSTTPTAGG